MEVIIAMVILTATAGVVGRFVYEVQKGLRDRERASCFSRELQNAAERLRSWDPSEISAAQIESMPMSDAITSRVDEPRWRASVKPISTPIDGLEIELQIECRLYEQLATPEKMTLWIANERELDAE
jgi:hypothetical protein